MAEVVTHLSRVPLLEYFEIDAAIRAYRDLGYRGSEIIEQMRLIFSFDIERVEAILDAA